MSEKCVSFDHRHAKQNVFASRFLWNRISCEWTKLKMIIVMGLQSFHWCVMELLKKIINVFLMQLSVYISNTWRTLNNRYFCKLFLSKKQNCNCNFLLLKFRPPSLFLLFLYPHQYLHILIKNKQLVNYHYFSSLYFIYITCTYPTF